MKKISIALTSLAVAAAIVSCKKQGEIAGSTAQVSFAITPEMAVTRGLPVDTAADIANMGVFAYYTGNGGTNNWSAKGSSATPNFMNHVTLTNTAGVWNYAHKVYWPQASDANVTFFAYSPYATSDNGITVMSTTGIPTISYTVPTSCAKQPDLMVSALKTDLNKNTNAKIPVNFAMKHTLACIGFKVTGNGEKITKIKMTGVVTTGTMTVAENGIPSWNLTGSPTGDFEATLNGGVTLVDTLQQANSSDGYLMMIPQTLPAGAKLLISLDDGRDFDFDISGKVWASGQRINYCVGTTPPITITPNNIILSKTGNYSEFKVIVDGDVANIPWKVQSSQTSILVCDNLADLQAWAAGTKTAAQVTNLDGSTPTQEYSYKTPKPSKTGSGIQTLYAWVNSSNTTLTDQTGTISLTNDSKVKTTVKQLAEGNPAGIPNTVIANSYVGAFWRADQTGERIIRIPIAAADAGTWDATVMWTDAAWPNDIAVFSDQSSTDAGITWNVATENPADMINSDATYRVTGNRTSVSGSVAGGGTIQFRIGLTSTFTPTEARPVRYAVLLLRYNNLTKRQQIFLRQGHDPDYIMRPNDPVNSGGMNSSTRPDAKRFSPYNITSPGFNPAAAGTQVPVGGGVFTRYPSQAGAFFQWAGSAGKERLAYHPINPVGVVTGWSSTWTIGVWSTQMTTMETCPANYTLGTGTTVNFRRPGDGSITALVPSATAAVAGSEVRQSLWEFPQNGETSSTSNLVWGYYADGFFDRRAIVTPLGTNPGANSAVSCYTTVTDARNANVAFIGGLLFNPTTYASFFSPAAGFRHTANGILYEAGSVSYWWINTTATSTLSLRPYFTPTSARNTQATYSNATIIRCVRP